MVEVRKGEFDAAIISLTRAIELGEGSALTYGLLGHAYSSVENHVTAESAYRRAMMLQSRSTDWQLGLARSLFKQEKYADAAALCSQLIMQNPENIDFWRLQANAYLGLEQPLKAAQNYEYLRSVGKADLESLNKLGDIYVKEKMLDIAAQAYSEALEKDSSQSPDIYVRNAKVLSNHGGLDEAHQLVRQIRKTFSNELNDKQNVELLRLEARIALKKGADEKQSALLQEIVRIDPMDGEALILLGQYFARKNDPEKAVFYYERAESIEAVEAKAKIRHAQLLVQESRYQEAIPLLESALRIEHRSEVTEYLRQVKAAAKSRN
jgi:tetratricopeptide (TPR) repeat protein